jgi:integrase
VADAASPPSAKAAKAPEMAWWTPDELSRFLDLVAGEEQFPLYRLAAMTGMRRGECCGLRWGDVDLGTGRVDVRQQYVVADHQAYFAPRTKSDHGRRTIDLDAKTTAILRAHRAQQVAWPPAPGTRIATSCSATRTASRATRRQSRRPSSAESDARAFRMSGSTI